MLALVIVAIIALALFGAGFVIKWLFIAAAIVALIWVIMFFTGNVRRTA
jgi:hypothetical protein